MTHIDQKPNKNQWIDKVMDHLYNEIDGLLSGFKPADTEKLFEARVKLRLVLDEVYDATRKGAKIDV